MPSQLFTDCLNEIFEYLEEDKISLRSCLLVNRLYCEVAVRILWRNVWNFPYSIDEDSPYRMHVPVSIISTLIACLPKESKDLLHKNGIVPPTWKPSLFNYASFCKVLSIHGIDQMVDFFLEKGQLATSGSLKYNKFLLSQEILKIFMKQISSLKSLDYDAGYATNIQNIMFTYFPGAENCLTDLSELNCSSNVHPDFFYQISQVCHNIQSLNIIIRDIRGTRSAGRISDGLTDLISLQKSLKSVTLRSHIKSGTEVIPSALIKLSLTLTKLEIIKYYIPLSFIAELNNLQELTLSFKNSLGGFVDFDQLQHVAFPKLKVLKFLDECPNIEMLIGFLEINGKNLTEFYAGEHDNSLSLTIAETCPNLKSLFIVFMKNNLETLKVILNSCYYLESIGVRCGDQYLDDREFLEVLETYSPKNLYELEIYYYCRDSYDLEVLEEFFINWRDHIPEKSLSLILITNEVFLGEYMTIIIEKYTKMGVIKKFRIGE